MTNGMKQQSLSHIAIPIKFENVSRAMTAGKFV